MLEAFGVLDLSNKHKYLKQKMNLKEQYTIAIIGCLTLGLAPFTPEPHLWGKLKWIWGGAVGMKPMDWFDALMHGAPFIFLIYLLAKSSFKK